MSANSKFEDIEMIVEAARRFDSNYLADVFRPWDCYSQDWHDTTTILLRFENDDLLVFEGELGLNCAVGPIDTNVFEAPIAFLMNKNQGASTCICWRSSNEFQDLVGAKETGWKLLSRFIRDEHGDCVELLRDHLE